jgi:cytochrome oxidase Cu insertion factor (SCO1/SenC/PrrC family)
MMTMIARQTVAAAGLVLLLSGALSAQTAQPLDVSKLGPQVGQAVPAFEGVDQFGKKHTLASIAKPRGTMLVFFRSADW